MVSARDLGQHLRRAIELPGLGQELHEAEPAPRVGDGQRRHALDELSGASGVPHAPMRHDRHPIVGEARLELQRLEEVQEKLRVLRALGRRSTSHVLVAVLTEEHAQLVVGPSPQRRSGGSPPGNLGHDHRPAQLLAGGEVGVAQVHGDDLVQRADRSGPPSRAHQAGLRSDRAPRSDVPRNGASTALHGRASPRRRCDARRSSAPGPPARP